MEITHEQAKNFIIRKFFSVKAFCENEQVLCSYFTLVRKGNYADFYDTAKQLKPKVKRVNPLLLTSIKSSLKQQGFLLKDLADKCGLSQQTLRNTLTCKRSNSRLDFVVSVLQSDFKIQIQAYETDYQADESSDTIIQKPSSENTGSIEANTNQQYTSTEHGAITTSPKQHDTGTGRSD